MQPQQRTPEWYADRLGRATASKFKDIMAGENTAGYKNYRAELVVERLTGVPLPSFTSAAMQWGIDTEPLARLRYLLATKNQVQECGFFKFDDIMAGASPDGLVGKDGLLEIKCPNTATHLVSLRGGIPVTYFWQIVGQQWVTGRKWTDFVSFDPRLPDNAQLVITRVKRQDAAIEKLAAKVQKFLLSVDAEEAYVKNYGKEPTNE